MLEKFPGVRAQLEPVAEARLARDASARPIPPGLRLDDFLNQGLFEAQNLLLIDLDNCTRCDACVQACAKAHDGVSRLLRDGLRYDHFLVATACRSCRDPLCMTQCPVGSIRRKENLEIIIEDWCIGCGKCAELCPYGNINMHPLEVIKEVKTEVKSTNAGRAAHGEDREEKNDRLQGEHLRSLHAVFRRRAAFMPARTMPPSGSILSDFSATPSRRRASVDEEWAPTRRYETHAHALSGNLECQVPDPRI